MAVEASVVIELGNDVSSGSVVVEMDEQHINNQDEEGELKSSFTPQEFPVILIHHNDLVEITNVKCTHGSVELIGINKYRTRETDALFTSQDTEISISYSGVQGNSLAWEWFGNEANPYLSVNNIKLYDTGSVLPAYGHTVFEVRFNEQWMLTPPPISLGEDETYTIYIVIYARAVT